MMLQRHANRLSQRMCIGFAMDYANGFAIELMRLLFGFFEVWMPAESI